MTPKLTNDGRPGEEPNGAVMKLAVHFEKELPLGEGSGGRATSLAIIVILGDRAYLRRFPGTSESGIVSPAFQ
jgi:hypothetical protein